MSRCVQFHHLYDKDAEACGMSPVSESYYKRYREAVRKLANQKLDEDMIYDAFKEGAYRVILSIKSEDTRTDALSYVSECLHNGEKVTDRDLRGWLKVWRIEHGEPEPEKLTNVNSPTPVTDVKPEVPPQPSLADQVRAQEMATATENQPNANTPVKCSHSNGETCQIHGVDCKGLETGCNRFTTEPNPPRLLHKPFKTAAEVLAHDKDPLGIGQDPATVRDNITVQPSKTDKELFLEACQMAYEHGNSEFKMMVDEHMRYHPSWKTPASVIFFCVTDPKEALGGMKK